MSASWLNDPTALFDDAAPRRVVSLVPSVTASLFDLGIGEALVGVTDYCTYPAEKVAELPKLGGPKNPRVADILGLRPDLIIANREENDRESIEALAAAGANVWLTFPTSVRESIADLWTLANLFRSDLAMQQVDYLERAVEWAGLAGASQPAMRYFCPIWEDRLESGEPWWMTFNAKTYLDDVLRIFNGENVFASRERCYPLLADLGHVEPEEAGERDIRFPRVSLAEILAAQPDLILLPSEPYPYSPETCEPYLQLFAQTPAVQAGRVYTIDGTLITWHGTRLARALEELQPIFNS